MAAPRVRLTDAEFAVLEPLWHSGPQTIRQLTATLYPEQSVSDYATVQKLLGRLEAKRCVRRDRSQPAHVFHAAIARADLIDHELNQIAERLCDGSLVPVLDQLVRRTRLSKQDRQRLRKLIDDGGKP
ncbi:MAG: BlaI/MecI/CopY family transcriptional regulator [Pirellulales bacterium]